MYTSLSWICFIVGIFFLGFITFPVGIVFAVQGEKAGEDTRVPKFLNTAGLLFMLVVFLFVLMLF